MTDGCDEYVTIGTWKIRCLRTNQHKIHTAFILNEEGVQISLQWDTRPRWVSPDTLNRLTANRAAMIEEANPGPQRHADGPEASPVG